MSFLPIVERELRVRSRARGTHFIRVGAALLAIGLVGWMVLLMGGNMTQGKTGRHIFLGINWLALVFCLLEGPRVTADTLSREKRQGTLGLLFLTNLRGYDVVLGKLAACSLNSFYSLLALLPPTAIPFLIGGVSGVEFGRLVVSLVNALFFSLAIGMLISAISRTERDATVATGLTVLLLSVGPVWVAGLPPLLQLSPVLVFLNALDGEYAANPAAYWMPLKLTHGLAWLSLGAACLILPGNWSDRGGLRRPRRLPRFLAVYLDRLRRIELARNPVVWLGGQPFRFTVYIWTTVLAAAAGGLIWLLLSFPVTDPEDLAIPFLVALLVHLMLAMAVALQACYALPHARDSGELEVLLTTPLRTTAIVRGYTEALRGPFRQPLIFLLTIEVVIFGGQLLALSVIGPADEILVNVFLAGAGAVCIAGSVLDLEVAVRFGLWMGLRSAKPALAVTWTSAVLLGPLVLMAACCFVMAPVVWIAKNVMLIRVSRNELEALFRRTAAEHFAAFTPAVKRKRREEPKLPSVT